LWEFDEVAIRLGREAWWLTDSVTESPSLRSLLALQPASLKALHGQSRKHGSPILSFSFPRRSTFTSARFAQMSRREQLEQLLAAEPQDPFLRYGLAMCCASDGQVELAQEHFRQLLADHPDYVAGYFQLAQVLARLGENEQAKPLLHMGIEVAVRRGDNHAAREMTEFLASI
jgi:tetratricopeptide (TPR) repeat protein